MECELLCSKLKPTLWMPLAIPKFILDFCSVFYNLSRVMAWLSKEMHFLLWLSFSELWLHMPMFICVRCVLCLASALLPALHVPVPPVGHLGICAVTRWFGKILLSEPSDLSYQGPESYQVLLSWQRDKINPSKEITAAVGVESFWGPVIEEDKEIKVHGWQMVEVWLEIWLSRNILF